VLDEKWHFVGNNLTQIEEICTVFSITSTHLNTHAHPYTHTHTHTHTNTRSVPLYIPPLTFPQPTHHTQKHTTLHSIHRHTTYHSSIQYRYGIIAFLYPMLMPEHTLTVCNWHCTGGLWRGGNGNNMTAIPMCGYRSDRYLCTVQSQ